MKEKILAIVLVLVVGLTIAWGGEVYEKTRAGNQLWHQGKYQDAFAKYTEALAQAKGPSQAQLHYNLGTSLYKQQRYEEAVKEFESALASQDPKLKEKAYYNLGNCYFRIGMAQKNIEPLKKAAESYQKALEIDPNDQDAKHNLEVVRRHIKLQMEQPPPQACPQPKPQPDQEKGEQKQLEQSKQAQAPQEKEQKQEPKPGQAGQPRELTKEEAERILRALSEQEKEELKKRMAVQAISRPSGKDW